MSFRIKKSILAGTSGHRKALSSAEQQLNINRTMDQSSLPDGRAKSSAFQLTGDEKGEWVEVWDPATKTYKKVKKGETTTTTTTTSQKGTASRTVPPKQEVEKIVKKGEPGYDKWLAAVTKDPSIEDKYKPSVETKPLSKVSEDVDVKTEEKAKKKKPCECQLYNKDGSKGRMTTWLGDCSQKPPGCSPPSETPTTKFKGCSCTPKGGESIHYPCDEPKPAACASKFSTTDCPDSRRESCPNSSWNWKKCRCNKKKHSRVKKVRVKKRCFKGSKLKECLGVDGGIKTSMN